MDINKIEILLRAIELGSLSKAATEYSYTPSALSHIVDSIEQELCAQIILRTNSGIKVIENQQETVNSLKELVNMQNKIIRKAQVRSNDNTVLTLATYPSVFKRIIPEIIKGFNKIHPNIHIDIIIDNKLRSVYESGTADVLFGENIATDDAVWKKFMTDSYIAVFPVGQAPQKEFVTKEDLTNKNFILVKDNAVMEYLKDTAIKKVIKVHSHDDSAVIQMVKEGMGVSILTSLAAEDTSQIIYKKLMPDLKRQLGIIYKKDDFNKNQNLQKFVEYIERL